ncbi:MAG: ABC transporter ATP-binding protein [Clostridia bacterium]|nr:ABC transporter ATP-binding protein [Clostridia bacterium]
MKDRKKKDSRIQLRRMLAGQGVWFALSLVSSACATLFTLLIPIVIQVTVDSVLRDDPFRLPAMLVRWISQNGGRSYLQSHLWICAAAVFLLALLNGISMFGRTYSSRRAAEGVAKNLRDRLLDHYQKLNYAEYHDFDSGDVIQRCTTDVDTIKNFASMRIVELSRCVFVIAIASALMLSINTRMFLMTTTLIPPVLVVSIFYFLAVEKRFLAADEAEGEMTSTLQENVAGVRVVRAFGQEKEEVKKFNAKNEFARKMNQRVSDSMALFWGLTDAAGYVQMAISTVAGCVMCIRGDITIGEVIVFATYANMMVWPVRQMGRILADFGKSKVAWTRLYDVLSRPREDMSGDMGFVNGDIVFDHVSFSYDGKHEILHDICFTAKKGQTVAILGRTGSGKSTLVSLLARLYDPTEGKILLGDREYTSLSKECIRRNVGMVLQESFLYSRTLEENIRIGKQGATREEIEQAAQLASLTEVVETFPDGFETPVGERGISLSGGQRQRVAIARTLLRGTPVLILDDSLSAVDTATDAKIRTALQKRQDSEGCTTFLISHRIGTLMRADWIIVLEDGTVSQQGTCEQLLAQEGLFRDLYEIQTERIRQGEVTA